MKYALMIHIVKYWALYFVPLALILFVRPARLRVRRQALWTAFLLLCAAKGAVFGCLGGDIFAPKLPSLVLWLFNWLEGGLFFLVLLSLVWWVRRGRTVILPILAWGAAAWGIYCGLIPPEVRTVELGFSDLPPSLDGYRIVQVSDIHCSYAVRKWRTESIVEAVNRLDADLVCLTGDFVDGFAADLGDDLLPLRSLRAKDGVYAVRGNHEYYRDSAAWRRWFEANGFKFLAESCVFPRAGLALGGVDDCAGWRKGAKSRVSKAFAAATNGEFRVLLEHRPSRARDNIASHGVRLQLSGHTHGGIGPVLMKLVERHNAGFVRGVYRLGGGILHVSPGTGQWAGFPMRFFNPSEITLITLRRAF